MLKLRTCVEWTVAIDICDALSDLITSVFSQEWFALCDQASGLQLNRWLDMPTLLITLRRRGLKHNMLSLFYLQVAHHQDAVDHQLTTLLPHSITDTTDPTDIRPPSTTCATLIPPGLLDLDPLPLPPWARRRSNTSRDRPSATLTYSMLAPTSHLLSPLMVRDVPFTFEMGQRVASSGDSPSRSQYI